MKLVIICSIFYTMIVSNSFASSGRQPKVPKPESITEIKEGEHVIIIGAGAAGISAAYTLEYLGVPYTLLEASDDFGGRVKEIPAGKFLDIPIDLGAEWIHCNSNILQDLILFDDHVDLKVIKYNPKSICTYNESKNQRYHRNWLGLLYANREHKFYDATWYSYFKTYFYPYVKNQLKTHSVVESIDYSNTSQIIVATMNGSSYIGTKVIVATPVTIIKNGEIEFEPEIPSEIIDAINTVEMAHGLKVLIEFDEHFFPDIQVTNSLFTIPFIETTGEPLFFDGLFGKDQNRNMLTMLQVGDKTGSRINLTEEELITEILEELDRIFANDKITPSDHYIKSFVQNWSKEPYIQGAYSINRVDKQIISEPLGDNSLYFCGEYLPLDDADQAMVHGAAISGRNAALKVYSTL